VGPIFRDWFGLVGIGPGLREDYWTKRSEVGHFWSLIPARDLLIGIWKVKINK
jgi:hypothetical protein